MDTQNTHGYIYIRNHTSYDEYNCYKLGKADNIPNRDGVYATGEIKRGYFELVIEMDKTITTLIEKMLQNYFNSLGFHLKFDGGNEFYKREIITLIIPFLKKTNIKFRILSKNEIDNLIRTYYIKKIIEKKGLKPLNVIKPINFTNNEIINYIPREDQKIIIDKSIIHFNKHDKGLLVLMCGVGKTLISLWITQKLQSNTILIGVPNKLLLKQWENIIKKLFTEIPYLIVYSNTNIKDIHSFLEKYGNNKCIIISTYASSYKINSATTKKKFRFDMKINDEVHHLTSYNMNITNTTKSYIQMLNIESDKQLSLTATLKQLDNACDNDNIISNDNVSYFGDVIDKKCLLHAINENIICDYVIQSIVTNDEDLNIKFIENTDNDKRLFLSAFAALKSISTGTTHHLLIYANNMNNSLTIIKYIKLLLENKYFNIHELYYSNYDSVMNKKEQEKIIRNFENAKNGIITCVYCLGEGWDFPLLDGVVFAENMTSNIRIVQSALRASRKNILHPNKITKIILPILNTDDWINNNDNPDLKKVKEVIYQMGLEDETIIQKIKVYWSKIYKYDHPPSDIKIKEIEGYDAELTQKLRLKTISRRSLDITYEKARKILIEKNIKNKEEYLELCKIDNRLTEEPDITYKCHFTNWIDYLSIERKYYDLETCKNKIQEYLNKYPDIKKNYMNLAFICDELCKLDDKFPPNGLWVDYYNVSQLREVIIITTTKKKISTLLRT
jgi:superfamily II DNA or RNA helicase